MKKIITVNIIQRKKNWKSRIFLSFIHQNPSNCKIKKDDDNIFS